MYIYIHIYITTYNTNAGATILLNYYKPGAKSMSVSPIPQVVPHLGRCVLRGGPRRKPRRERNSKAKTLPTLVLSAERLAATGRASGGALRGGCQHTFCVPGVGPDKAARPSNSKHRRCVHHGSHERPVRSRMEDIDETLADQLPWICAIPGFIRCRLAMYNWGPNAMLI